MFHACIYAPISGAGDGFTGKIMSGITWLSPGGLRLARPSCSLMAWPTCQPGGALQGGGSPSLQRRVGWTPTWQPAPCAFQTVSTCTSCPPYGVSQEQFAVTMHPPDFMHTAYKLSQCLQHTHGRMHIESTCMVCWLQLFFLIAGFHPCNCFS